jgi:hypothetical protein
MTSNQDSVRVKAVALNLDVVARSKAQGFRYRFSERLHVERAGQLFDAPSRRRMIVSNVSSLDPRFASSFLSSLEIWIVVTLSDMADRKPYNGYGGYNVAIV